MDFVPVKKAKQYHHAKVQKQMSKELDWSEADIQKCVVKFFDDLKEKIKTFDFYSVVGGSVRVKPHIGRNLKLLGVKAGIHDLVFLGQGGKTIFIELKVKPNTLTDAQQRFHGIVTSLGFASFCIYVKDGSDAIEQIIKILVAHQVLKEPICGGL